MKDEVISAGRDHSDLTSCDIIVSGSVITVFLQWRYIYVCVYWRRK